MSRHNVCANNNNNNNNNVCDEKFLSEVKKLELNLTYV